MNFSWAMELDPKGINNQIKEAIDKRYATDEDESQIDDSGRFRILMFMDTLFLVLFVHIYRSFGLSFRKTDIFTSDTCTCIKKTIHILHACMYGTCI